MLESTLIRELSNKISEIIKTSPVADVGKNIHALIQGIFTKMELVSREEFEVQARLLENAQKKLVELENKLRALEEKAK